MNTIDRNSLRRPMPNILPLLLRAFLIICTGRALASAESHGPSRHADRGSSSSRSEVGHSMRSSDVAKFYAKLPSRDTATLRANDHDQVPWLRPAEDFVEHLPPARQLAVARALVADRNTFIAYLGADLLIDTGHEEEAAPVLAQMWADGRIERDLHGRLGFNWTHHEDEERFGRMSLRTAQALLDHLDAYRGAERDRAETYIRGVVGTETFSREDASARLAEKMKDLPKPPRRPYWYRKADCNSVNKQRSTDS